MNATTCRVCSQSARILGGGDVSFASKMLHLFKSGVTMTGMFSHLYAQGSDSIILVSIDEA